MILSMTQILAYTSLSRSTIYKYISMGLFPAPIKLLGSNRIGFLKSEIDTWIAERVEARDRELSGG